MATIAAYLVKASEVSCDTLVFAPTPEHIDTVSKSRPPKDRPYSLEYIAPRRIQQHRFFWAFLTKLVHARNEAYGETHWTPALLHEWVKYEIGHVSTTKLTDPVQIAKYGEVVVRPKSTNFKSMDQTEWAGYWERARKALLVRFLPADIITEAVRDCEVMIFGAPVSEITERTDA